MPVMHLKPGREKSVLRRHPWLFSGAVAGLDHEVESGSTIKIQSNQGDFLAWGAYSPASQIRARIWSWDEKDTIDREFFRSRLEKAISARRSLLNHSIDNAFRLVHGESDGLPGLIVDQYGNNLVIQILSAGIERWRDALVEVLLDLIDTSSVYERSDVDVRKLEGLEERKGLLYGERPAAKFEVLENGLRFWVDIYQGHKTGAYLDQRTNRELVKSFSQERKVLDCFCYTGGFSVYALSGGAVSVLAIDSSENALDLGKQNVILNNLPQERIDWVQGDVFLELRRLRDRREKFDMIVLDPPKFAQTASQSQQAARGYKDINLLALKLLRPGGVLFTFSCSGGVDPELFQKIIAGAALDAGVDAQIIGWLRQAMDHPVALNFPEGAYLKGLIVRVS